jgi:hypothetical protein
VPYFIHLQTALRPIINTSQAVRRAGARSACNQRNISECRSRAAHQSCFDKINFFCVNLNLPA